MLALVFAVAAAVLDWVGVARKRSSLEYVGKPAVLMMLIVWLLSQAPSPMPFPATLFLIGLFASLLGDILLMVPGNRFLGGLAAFLVADLAYIAALNGTGLPPLAWGLPLAAAVAVTIAILLDRLRRGLQSSGHGWVFPFIAFYGIALGGMVWSAVATPFRPTWPPLAGWVVAVGGLLFFVSDVTNVWNRFLQPVRGGRLTTHILYHAGQITLTSGMLLMLRVP
jgi:alkenylglycerophosphocholine/alkenylglycerophosphoethanolamine hydrolase